METLEERNLNRLRKGKMMLEYADLKRSPVYTFALASFFGYLGAHRFYLGQTTLGLIILLSTIGLGVGFALTGYEVFDYLIGILAAWIIVEIVLAPIFTSHKNRKLKQRLMEKYNVVEAI